MGAVALVPGAIGAIFQAVGFALDQVKDDNQKREQFTKNFVDEARKQYPDYNIVIIHTPHSREGNFIHEHHELPMTVGTCGYEAYFSKIGEPFSLENQGDGGYINWAFAGYQRDGKRIWAE